MTPDHDGSMATNHVRTHRASLGEGLLFWFLYLFSTFIVSEHLANSGGIHQAVLGHTPGATSMERYVMGWSLFTAALIVVYTWRLRFLRCSWIIGTIAGIMSFLPGMVMCVLGIP